MSAVKNQLFSPPMLSPAEDRIDVLNFQMRIVYLQRRMRNY